ncbi:MAG: hypothetical protein JWM33_1048 [Caulobacteraceae bacterium]|nr:hypothetical protein [Caulobacteraceae bacterium]
MTAFLQSVAAERLDTITHHDWSEDHVAAWLAPKLDLPRSLALLALDHDQVIGLLDLNGGVRPHNLHIATLGMSVAKGYRGQGLGSRMLREALTLAKTWPGLCRLELECAPWNAPALRLYQKFGFEVEAVRRKGINLRGAPEDDLSMVLIWSENGSPL